MINDETIYTSSINNKYKDLLYNEHFIAFNAIILWHDILQKLTNYKIDEIYNNFISNANSITNTNIENDINKIIYDFYNYFYTDKHIITINYSKYESLTNDYINLYDLCQILTSKEKSILRDLTFYTFNLIISVRDKINLPIFENKTDDMYLIKYFT